MRPIDADALMQSLEESCHALRTILEEPLSENDRLCAKWQLVSFLENKMRVRNFPTLTLDDLRPNGTWNIVEIDKAANRIAIECPECGMVEEMSLSAYGMGHNFCHSCGADMRGGGEDG